MASQEEDYKQEKRDLGNLMDSKVFRSFIWDQVLAPCGFFDIYQVRDDAHNSKVVALHDVAADIIERVKDANLEAYFAMERENRLEEEVQQEGDKE